MANLLDMALKFVARGYSVFSTHNKIPALRGESVEVASVDRGERRIKMTQRKRVLFIFLMFRDVLNGC